MGLMYIFPTSEAETERIEIEDSAITVKTYGLPMIFWGYALIILAVTLFMWTASKELLLKMINYDNDITLVLLGYMAIAGLFFIPFLLWIILFYEKHLKKCARDLTIKHKIFFITIHTKNFKLESDDALHVIHYLDSPNMARLHNHSEMAKYKNRGYFELMYAGPLGQVRIDRHSSKAELLKLKALLEKY